MRIRLSKILAGPALRGQPGEEIDVDARTGRDLIAAQAGTEVKVRRAERAVAPAGEHAVASSAEVDAQRHLGNIAAAEVGAALAEVTAAASALQTEIGILEGQLTVADDVDLPAINAELAAKHTALAELTGMGAE